MVTLSSSIRCFSRTPVSLQLGGGGPRGVRELAFPLAITHRQLLSIPDCFPRADLIVNDHSLLALFRPLLSRLDELGETLLLPTKATEALAPRIVTSLSAMLTTSSRQRFGLIIDDAQKITEAVEKGSVEYFKTGWHNWDATPGTAFVRMEIASSHGEKRQVAFAFLWCFPNLQYRNMCLPL